MTPTSFTLKGNGPIPIALLTTLQKMKEVAVRPLEPPTDFRELEALSPEEEEQAFRQATLQNNRRFWSENAENLL